MNMFMGAATGSGGYLSTMFTSAPSTFMSFFRRGSSENKGGGLADQ